MKKTIFIEEGAMEPNVMGYLSDHGYVVLPVHHLDGIRIEPQMSLRDRFASAAMGPILASAPREKFDDRQQLRRAVASQAYELADAMLAERDK